MSMKDEPIEEVGEGYIRPDSWWYRVYVLVIAWTIVVITALWFLSRYFSAISVN